MRLKRLKFGPRDAHYDPMDQFEDGAVSLDQGETEQLLSCPVLPGPVLWRRSPRARRVSLRIDARSGAVVVTLPQRAARHAGVALLTTHAAWVRERLAALAPHIALEPGSEVPLGGALHVIRAVPGMPAILGCGPAPSSLVARSPMSRRASRSSCGRRPSAASRCWSPATPRPSASPATGCG